MREKKNLQMSLKTKWFEMTKSGEKKEEYREITNYWFKRLFGQYIIDAETGLKTDPYPAISQNTDIILNEFDPIPFKNNVMTLGYPSRGDTERTLVFEHLGIEIREGKESWGAKKGVKYFVIKHGKQKND